MTAPTREQSILGWAIHCDLIDSRDIDQEFVKSILEKLKEFSDLAYAAGQTAEREECTALHDSEDVLAPVGQSAWGEAYQDGWIAGVSAYREAISARGKHE